MTDLIPTTTVTPCPKCGTLARLAESESAVRCQACNALVSRKTNQASGGQELAWQRTVLVAGVVVLGAGMGIWALGRHPPPPTIGQTLGGHDGGTSLPPSKLPAATPLPSIPAGEIAWIPDARGPLLLDHGGDGGTSGVEDVFGFFRVWDGRSAWTTFAGVFSGSSLAQAWRTEPLDPWLVRRTGSVPMALALGNRMVVADATQTLRIYTIAGAKEATYLLAQPPRELCRATGPGDSHVWIDLDAPVTLDLDSGKTVPTPAAPPTCRRLSPPSPPRSRDAGAADASRPPSPACADDFQNHQARASCLAGEALPKLDDVTLRYAVTDGSAQIALGTTVESPRIPTVVGLLPGGKVAWKRRVAADTTTRSTELVPRLAELANGKLYVLYDKVYFDSRLEALDVKTGETAWDVPVVGTLPRTASFEARGEARSLVVSAARVYVARAGGGLDVFDAATGANVGTIGSR